MVNNTPQEEIDVSIILINFKTPNLVYDAINSVIDKTDGIKYEIIVVDNSNSETDFANLRKAISHNALVLNPKVNLGFGKGNNFGAQFAKGKALFFLNSDTILINNAVLKLYNFLFSSSEIGAVGANLYTKQLNPNNSYFLKEKNLRTESSSYFFQNLTRKIRNNFYFNHTTKPLSVKGYICGASLMVKKDVFDFVGGFDSDIFMYAEDSLLCYQIIKKTKKLIFNVPDAKIIHLEGGSFDGLNPTKAQYIVDGNYLYYLKAFGADKASAYLKKVISKLKKKLFACYLVPLSKKARINSTKQLLLAYRNKLKSINS